MLPTPKTVFHACTTSMQSNEDRAGIIIFKTIGMHLSGTGGGGSRLNFG